MPPPLSVAFVAGPQGAWRVDRVRAVIGEGLPAADRLDVVEGAASVSGVWVLRGMTSNTRYTNRPEVAALGAVQQGLARPHATRAALIPIRKTEAWWALAQDERRTVFEEQSRHIGIGMDFLPAIARRLHHSRELGEKFDFLTWFEYAPEDAARFAELLRRLRETPEWGYIDREVEIFLSR